jgi:oxamate amidohydrolase
MRSAGSPGALPTRGALAALTVPGTIDGWAGRWRWCPRATAPAAVGLLAPAIALARDGIAVTDNQSRTTASQADTLKGVPGFDATFLVDGAPPAPGHRLRQTALGDTLARLAEAGLDDFYRGDIAATHARFLQEAGSPLRLDDFHRFAAPRSCP